MILPNTRSCRESGDRGARAVRAHTEFRMLHEDLALRFPSEFLAGDGHQCFNSTAVALSLWRRRNPLVNELVIGVMASGGSRRGATLCSVRKVSVRSDATAGHIDLVVHGCL